MCDELKERLKAMNNKMLDITAYCKMSGKLPKKMEPKANKLEKWLNKDYDRLCSL